MSKAKTKPEPPKPVKPPPESTHPSLPPPAPWSPWTDDPKNFWPLIAEWIEDKLTRQDELVRALRFAGVGKVLVKGLITMELAASAYRHGEASDEVVHYPTIGNLLRFLAGCPVVPCDPAHAHYIVALAGEMGAGLSRGDIMVLDPRTQEKPDDGFKGVLIHYKAVPPG